MEADERLFGLLEAKYRAQSRIGTVCAKVNAKNIDALLEQAGAPAEPDVLAIDVDGQDYWIWEGIERYRPRVVVIEYNSTLDPRRRLVQPDDPYGTWDGSDYGGASLGALRVLGERKGYRLVHTELTGLNAFFVRGDLTGDWFPAPPDVPMRGTPNYFLSGYRHRPAGPGRQYLDLDTGTLVSDAP